MRRFVEVAAIAVTLSVISVGSRGDTVSVDEKPVTSVTIESQITPSPYVINHSDDLVTQRPPSQHDNPPAVPLPGAAWAGIAMMVALLIGRHINRRRRRLV